MYTYYCTPNNKQSNQCTYYVTKTEVQFNTNYITLMYTQTCLSPLVLTNNFYTKYPILIYNIYIYICCVRLKINPNSMGT